MTPMPILQNPSSLDTIGETVRQILNSTLEVINMQIMFGVNEVILGLKTAQIRRREEEYDTGDTSVIPLPPVDYGDTEGPVEDLDDENVLKQYLYDLVHNDDVYESLLKGEATDGGATGPPEDIVEHRRRSIG
jgi:hypothetical protein